MIIFPKNHDYIFKIISKCSKLIKVKSYIIGGYVRDLLLNNYISSSNDIDITTSCSGEILANIIAKHINPTVKVVVFKHFRTAMLKYKNIQIEFVGFRKESYNVLHRNPKVTAAKHLIEDQLRRDFTINSLAISLNYHDYGKLIDPFNGVSDLKMKIIKTPTHPNITYSDDPLRMFRAIRFANQLKFRIEKNSLHAIKNNIHRINILSIERITNEFNKILLTDKPSRGLSLLYKVGILEKILPEITKLKGKDKIHGYSHKDNFLHTLKVVDNISKYNNNLWLKWAALLHDIGKYETRKFCLQSGWSFHSHEFIGSKMIPKIFKRLKLPMDNRLKYVQKLVKYSSRPIALVDKDATDSAFRRLLFNMGDYLNDLMILCNADITTKNNKKKLQYEQNFKIVINKLSKIQKKDKIRNWISPISGYDIMKLFNITPSYKIGVIKQAIKNAVLNNEIQNTYQDAFKIMLIKGKELGLVLKNT
jgi:tRNA nucleotidyltransferase/poly(A) polymerase